MTRKVLIITYYWPPSGGSAVLRWLKFSKYLREFGWEPVIYTPFNPEPQETDESLMADIPADIEIIKTRIVEPYGIYKWLTGKKKDERLGVALMNEKKSGLMSRFSLWIRSNLFIPDPRVLWIRPSVNYLTQYLKQHPVDVIVSTGPPHSMHLIALRLKKKTGLKWIADFRDPWTNIDFYKELILTAYADKRHRKLENIVLHQADHIITVSPGMTREFKNQGLEHITTLTNGYDNVPILSGEPSKGFSILHLGSMPKSRNPENLWKVLSALVSSNKNFASLLKIRLIGRIDVTIMESIRQHHLEGFVSRELFVPNNQAIQLLTQASVLLLCINKTANADGILTNKFFEYLSANRPVLAIGPTTGDVSVILNETNAGKIFEYDDIDSLKAQILYLFELYSQHKTMTGNSGIEKYSRRNLTRELSVLLNKVIS
jgi:glycosyltransferase involved in cell wall biosynthesis